MRFMICNPFFTNITVTLFYHSARVLSIILGSFHHIIHPITPHQQVAVELKGCKRQTVLIIAGVDHGIARGAHAAGLVGDHAADEPGGRSVQLGFLAQPCLAVQLRARPASILKETLINSRYTQAPIAV